MRWILDIYKIANVLPSSIPNTRVKDSSRGEERDSDGGGIGYQRDPEISEEEANSACQKLADSELFREQGLTVEVRAVDHRFFLDVFDPKRKVIRTIKANGILAILQAGKNSKASHKSQILDRKV